MELPGYCSVLIRFWREAGADGVDQWCGEAEQIQSSQRWRLASVEDLVALLFPPVTADSQAATTPRQASCNNES